MKAKELREDELIDSFIHFAAAHQVSIAVIERPDRLREEDRQHRSLTSDALVSVDTGQHSRLWVLEVMSLSLPGDWAEGLRALDERMTDVATRSSVDIQVLGTLPPAESAKEVQKFVQDAIHVQGSSGNANWNGTLEIRWTAAESQGAVTVSVLMQSTSASLSDQIAESARAAVEKKLNGQMQRASDSSLPFALLLDGVGHPDMSLGTHWLPQHPETFRDAMVRVYEELGKQPDSTYYVDRANQRHHISGRSLEEFP